MKSLVEFITESKNKNQLTLEYENLIMKIIEDFHNASIDTTINSVKELFGLSGVKPVKIETIDKLGDNDICIGYNKKDNSFCLGIYDSQSRGFKGFQYDGTNNDKFVYTTKKGYIQSWEGFTGYTEGLKVKYIYFTNISKEIKNKLNELTKIYGE